MAIKTVSPRGTAQKAAFDGAGRVTTSYSTDGGGDAGYSDADDVTGDTVLEQSETTFDGNGNVLATALRRRFHDASGTGALGTPSSGVAARVTYMGYYYDTADRPTATADVGTNPVSGTPTAWTRPGSVPSRSDAVLVTSQTYDAAGRTYETTDPMGTVGRTLYDALGRTTKTLQNYVDGTVSDGDDKTTEYTYNAAGMTSLTAKLTGGGGQTTEWVYGVTTGGGSAITSNDVVGATRWPDPSTGAASSGQQDTVTVNAMGQTVTSEDRNGTVHTFSYDVLGRVTADAVTTLGSGVDGAVRRIGTEYDGQGNPYRVTSYDAASSGSVVNQVQRAYNGLGQLVTEWQAVSGSVNTSTTPKVQYAYTEMASGANHSRPTGMTNPSGYVLTSNYSSGLNADISRLTSLSDSTATVEGYEYLGLGTLVKRTHPQSGVDLSYVKLALESNGDAGDQYAGLDRFGRVVDQRWVDGTGADLDREKYGYDRAGSRLYADNQLNNNFDELYHANGASAGYDGLYQLTTFRRGALSDANSDGVPDTVSTASRTQVWDFDAVGNMESVTTDGVAQTRTHNKQNEIAGISSATTPTYDAAGNMTADEAGTTFSYDAWGRVISVNGTAWYAYDGANRRIQEGSRALYYTASWQVAEERASGVAVVRNVWSPAYIDGLVLRDRDSDANGSLEERLYALQDGNWNVQAVVGTDGLVKERYAFDPYGARTVLSSAWAGTTTGYAWILGHQGGRLDAATGMYAFRYRDADPALMRWITTDPIDFRGGTVNLFEIESNSPIATLDASGLQSRRPLKPTPRPMENMPDCVRAFLSDNYGIDYSNGELYLGAPVDGYRRLIADLGTRGEQFFRRCGMSACDFVRALIAAIGESTLNRQDIDHNSYDPATGPTQINRDPWIQTAYGHVTLLVAGGWLYRNCRGPGQPSIKIPTIPTLDAIGIHGIYEGSGASTIAGIAANPGATVTVIAGAGGIPSWVGSEYGPPNAPQLGPPGWSPTLPPISSPLPGERPPIWWTPPSPIEIGIRPGVGQGSGSGLGSGSGSGTGGGFPRGGFQNEPPSVPPRIPNPATPRYVQPRK